MKTMEREVVVIGAGPAGLRAAIEARRAGAQVLVIDENSRPGGQLFKQIHKFFGSAQHYAGCRGFDIGRELCRQAQDLGVELMLNSLAYGCFKDGIGMIHDGANYLVQAKRTILASGASEKYTAFPGATLPGVMGAGAAQTMVNLHRVLPGRRIVVLGSGNVGLIVAYQLLQAGAEIQAVVESAGEIGGYAVHAAKLRRAGVPILTRRMVSRALGTEELESVELTALDEAGQPIAGSEEILEADALCLAVGLSPLAELAWQAGVAFDYIPAFGGYVPLHDRRMETTLPGFYVAGDVTGVEEASVAMEEGGLAGVSAAEDLGHLSAKDAEALREEMRRRLHALNSGSLGAARAEAKHSQMAKMRARQEKEGEIHV